MQAWNCCVVCDWLRAGISTRTPCLSCLTSGFHIFAWRDRAVRKDSRRSRDWAYDRLCSGWAMIEKSWEQRMLESRLRCWAKVAGRPRIIQAIQWRNQQLLIQVLERDPLYVHLCMCVCGYVCMYVRTYVCMFVCTCMYVTTAPMSRMLKNIWNIVPASKHGRKHSRRTNSKQPFLFRRGQPALDQLPHRLWTRLGATTPSATKHMNRYDDATSNWPIDWIPRPSRSHSSWSGGGLGAAVDLKQTQANKATHAQALSRNLSQERRAASSSAAVSGGRHPSGGACMGHTRGENRCRQTFLVEAPGLPATAHWQRPGCCSPPASAPTMPPCCPGRWPRSPPFARVPNWNTALSLPARLLLWSRRAGLDAWKWESRTERNSQCAARPNDECTHWNHGSPFGHVWRKPLFSLSFCPPIILFQGQTVKFRRELLSLMAFAPNYNLGWWS